MNGIIHLAFAWFFGTLAARWGMQPFWLYAIFQSVAMLNIGMACFMLFEQRTQQNNNLLVSTLSFFCLALWFVFQARNGLQQIPIVLIVLLFVNGAWFLSQMLRLRKTS